MITTSGNRLLPLLAGIVLLMLVFVVLKSCSGEGGNPAVLTSVPKAPNPDADTPADTIKTLTANVAAMTAEVQALRQGNDALRTENRQLLASRNQIEESVTSRVRQELLARERQQQSGRDGDAQAMASLTQRVEALSRTLSEVSSRGDELPIGRGLEPLAPDFSALSAIAWIEPLEATSGASSPSGTAGLLQGVRASTGGLLSTARQAAAPIAGELSRRLPELDARPVYTVPRNATLIGSTALTALVGRIPVQGQVRDPMPFKVITGADNLAANGLRVSGVRGMVWSGTAIGDWTLSCVTGRLDSVTFVFDDGTIRTVSSDDQRNQSGGDEPLGWISDAKGIPCVSGERKTNAPAFLSQRVGVMAIEAAAEAAAAAQTNSRVTELGGNTSSVTGDLGTYVLGKTLSGGSDEVGRWLQERQSQSFDAVFVDAGARLTLHVDREISIDFDPNGRRLSHASLRDSCRRRLD